MTLEHLLVFVLAGFTFCFVQSRNLGPVEPIGCPECYAEGKHAQEDCENNIAFENCKINEVCAVGSFKKGDGFVFHRGCVVKTEYDQYKAYCVANKGSCVVAMCKKPNCRPELPVSG